MKNIINRKENGITLIALVITIIVLLILAGVAIAMLSGENGILKKAAEAKTETERAQKEEETILKDMELTTYFATNNMKYKYSNGYITGFTIDGSSVEETVEKFEDDLKPLGYSVTSKYEYNMIKDIGEDIAIEDAEKNTTHIATGMLVSNKDGNAVARTIVFGDTNCDGEVNSLDKSLWSWYSKMKSNLSNTMKVAMDVNCDGKINETDMEMTFLNIQEGNKYIYQNQYASNPNNIVENAESCLKYKYIIGIQENNIFDLEHNVGTDIYNFKVKTTETIKVEQFLNSLPTDGKIKRNGQDLATTEDVQNGDDVVYVFNEKEIFIGKIVIE